jgi:outer membrane protein
MSLKGRLRNGLATGLLLWTPLALLPAKPAAADTLMEALAKAYASSPNLAAEQANLRAIDENLPQAYAQRRPTITGQANAGYQPQNTSKVARQTLYPYSASISLTQPLLTGGGADAAIDQANYQIKAERANAQRS